MDKTQKIFNYFDELFSTADCSLDYKTPYELLVAVVLSAQCTDKRVNQVTPALFKVANTPQKMIALGEEKLKQYIHSCGFYNAKSKSILSASNDLVERFNGIVPNNMEDLISLAGVGRKTANVVIANAFGGQTIAVDTHVHRVSKRLGLTKENSTPYECEMNLLKIVPYEKRSKFHHQTILFGRNICKALHPLCTDCKIKDICKFYNANKK